MKDVLYITARIMSLNGKYLGIVHEIEEKQVVKYLTKPEKTVLCMSVTIK